MNPEDAVEETQVEEDENDEEETPVSSKNDLPWEEEEEAPKTKSNYTLKTNAKTSKADKFDALFEDED